MSLYLGRHLQPQNDAPPSQTEYRLGAPILYTDERHAILFGPNGSGKGTRLLMPNLLGDNLADHSAVVIDPKGELAAVCAWWQFCMRRKRPGSVRILDPFGKLREVIGNSPEHRVLVENHLIDSQGFNPLASIDPNSDFFYDDAAACSEALIRIEGNDPHWSTSAQGLTTGLIMWEVARPKMPGELPSLENVRWFLSEGDRYGKVEDDGASGSSGTDEDDKKDLVGGLAASSREIVESCGSIDARTGEPAIKGGLEIASLLGRFTQTSREIQSIQSTADTQTRWLLSRRMREDMNRPHGIDFRDLRKSPTTVFVILPAERMRTHSVWLRLVIVSALRTMYQIADGVRTMMFIDELAALGYLAPIEDAFGLVRGFGVQLVGILQDLSQLKALYKERWESMLANAGVVQGFAPNDLTTADWMSKRAGQMTVVARSESENASSQSDSRTGTSWSQIGLPRYQPRDLFGMPKGSGALWFAGDGDTVRFDAEIYDRIPGYDRRARKNPYYRG